MVTGVIDSILKHPDYSDAIIVFIPENAPAISASHFHTYVLGNPRVCTMCETAGQRPGVPKTQNTTRDMQYLMEMILSMGNLRFARRILTYKSTPDEMKNKLLSQLRKSLSCVRVSPLYFTDTYFREICVGGNA